MVWGVGVSLEFTKFPRKQEPGAGFGEISQNKDGTLLVKV